MFDVNSVRQICPALSGQVHGRPLIYLDNAAITPMAYNVDDNNYIMLRDLGLLLDFQVDFDTTTKTVFIDTTSSYHYSGN